MSEARLRHLFRNPRGYFLVPCVVPRPDTSAAPWVECPRCRRRMLRWGRYRQHREEPELHFDPDRWWLPGGPFTVAVFVLLVLTWVLPMKLINVLAFLLDSPRRGQPPPLVPLVLLALAGWAWLDWRARQRKRGRLDVQLREQDWICPNCLHSQPGKADE